MWVEANTVSHPFVIRLLHPGFSSLVLAKHCDLILSDFFCVDFVPLPLKPISLTYMNSLQRQRHSGGSELLVSKKKHQGLVHIVVKV